jgi:hypothetical protein
MHHLKSPQVHVVHNRVAFQVCKNGSCEFKVEQDGPRFLDACLQYEDKLELLWRLTKPSVSQVYDLLWASQLIHAVCVALAWCMMPLVYYPWYGLDHRALQGSTTSSMARQLTTAKTIWNDQVTC